MTWTGEKVRVQINGRSAVIFEGSKLMAIADGSVLVLPPGSAPSPTPLQYRPDGDLVAHPEFTLPGEQR